MSAESNSTCPVCRTAEVVCGKWTLLLIRDLADGSSRFCELERSLEGISPRTLSLRLRALEEEGIVERHTYPEVPPRVEYALTAKGEALVPLIDDMRSYGTRWLLGDDGRAGARQPRSNVQVRSPARHRAHAGALARRAEAWAVRDFLLNEALKRLATEAATRLSTLVADGRGDPLRRRRRAGDDSAFYSYVPLTGRYVADHAEELRALPELRPRPRGGGRGRRRRSLPGGARRGRARRSGRARRADADHLLLRALGGLAPASRSTATRLESALSMLDAEAPRRRRRRGPDRRRSSACGCRCRACSCPTASASSAPTRSRRRSTRCAARAWAAPPGSRSTSPSPSRTPRRAPRPRCSSCAS